MLKSYNDRHTRQNPEDSHEIWVTWITKDPTQRCGFRVWKACWIHCDEKRFLQEVIRCTADFCMKTYCVDFEITYVRSNP